MPVPALESGGDGGHREVTMGVPRLPAALAAQASPVCAGCSAACTLRAGNFNLGFPASGAPIIRLSSVIALQIGRKSKV